MPTDNNKNLLDRILITTTGGKPKPFSVEPYEISIDCGLSNMFFKEVNGKMKVPMPKKYIINHGATVLIWDNGEKTVVKRCEDDEFNKRLGFLTAFFQHYCGMSKNKANKFLAELEVENEEIETKETKKPKHMKGEK